MPLKRKCGFHNSATAVTFRVKLWLYKCCCGRSWSKTDFRHEWSQRWCHFPKHSFFFPSDFSCSFPHLKEEWVTLSWKEEAIFLPELHRMNKSCYVFCFTVCLVVNNANCYAGVEALRCGVHRHLLWCNHLEFLPVISMFPNRGWKSEIVWFLFANDCYKSLLLFDTRNMTKLEW